MAGQIPDVKIYKEIPFVDAPEGVFLTTTSHTEGILGPEDWAKIAPLLICVDDQGWAAIKKGWLEACRFANSGGRDACNIKVHSVADLIKQLDEVARAVYPAVKFAP